MYEHVIPSPAGPGQVALGELEVTSPARLRGQRLILHGERAVVGRDGPYVISSPLLSRQHLAVTRGPAGCVVEDLASTNGTWLDGVRIDRPCLLSDGARLRLGAEVDVVYHAAVRARPATPAVAASRTETTRLLAASAHLSRGFRRLVLRATVREGHRAVCASRGVDLSVVARHAVLAERREVVRDLFLVLVLAVVLAAPVALLGADAGDRLRGAALLVATALVASFMVSAAEGWTRDTLLARYLLGRPGGGAADAPHPRGAVAHRLAQLTEVDRGNVVVSSLWEPFVGSGECVDQKTFAVSLLPKEATEPGQTGRATTDFTAYQLLESLESDLSALALRGLRVEKRLMVDGVTAGMLPEILPDPYERPRAFVGEPALRAYADHPESAARTYLCAETVGWEGELIVTSFIRVVHVAGALFVEISAYVLYPVQPWLRQVDSLWIRSPGERAVSVFGRALGNAPLNLLAAPARLWAVAQETRQGRRWDREHRRHLETNTRIDYGARSSIRQTAMETRHSHFFLAMDARMYVQTITDRVLKRLTVFLDQHGYATAQIKNIQNNYDFRGASGNFVGVGTNARGTHTPSKGQQ